ncbi:DUF1415 domain-containing protein [Dokdonella sp.]|uniref:DUF1415 domain-containing protein n=1 Tax=Dokdonella sp. TaxID=2291710 RepID=UPI003C4462E8
MNPATATHIQAEGDGEIIARTRHWIERAVIGLNLCPFARAPFIAQRVRYRVSEARDTGTLLDELCGELQSLRAADPVDCETSLLIIPHVLADFLEFNDFLDEADAAIKVLGLEGEIQVASFHPDYQFADAAADDIENFSNRSPLPMLHLLREASIERAVDSMTDSDEIYRRNMVTLRTLGVEGWADLWRDPGEGA